MFLYMSLSLEPAETICERAGKGPVTTSAPLEQMAVKGLVFRHQKGAMIRYSAITFVLGIYEYQVGRMEKVLAQNFEEYFEEACYKSVAGVTSLLRPIPVNRSIETDSRIATYDDVKEILRKQNKIVIAQCICQVQQDLMWCSKSRRSGIRI